MPPTPSDGDRTAEAANYDSPLFVAVVLVVALALLAVAANDELSPNSAVEAASKVLLPNMIDACIPLSSNIRFRRSTSRSFSVTAALVLYS